MAEFVDELRRVFGPGVVVREVHNDKGDKVGKTLEESGEMRGYWTADQWLHMGQPMPSLAEMEEEIRKAQEAHARSKLGKRGKGSRRL